MGGEAHLLPCGSVKKVSAILGTLGLLALLLFGRGGPEQRVGAEEKQAPAPLYLLSRVRTAKPGEQATVQVRPLHWDARRTAVIICDMWDDHYCRNAARRVAEMAPRMNVVLEKARQHGALIIHCPSGCMNVYKDTPQRKLAQQAPPIKTKIPIQRWCYLDPKHEAPLPIDDSTPCDDEKPRERKRFYSRQIDILQIKEGDAITDSAEAIYLMRQRGIKNVIIMGVHANMCVLGRPFGIRQLVYQGFNVALMRDMTDTMYSPKQRPYVSHVRGTELVIGHIEEHWCPTIASTELTGQAAFRFAEDKRPRIAFIVGGGEYDADQTIPPFADELRRKFGFDCEVLLGRGKNEEYTIPGIDALQRADVLVLFLRRRALAAKEMERIRNYLAKGKPLVALRTTSHGFEVAKPPPGKVTWDGFDVEVLGGDYRGHGPGSKGTEVTVVAENASHPILTGIAETKWHSSGSLYSAKPVDSKATILLTGSFPGRTEPIAWTRTYKGSKIFYTSLGHRDDFAQEHFRRLLSNAIHWALGKEVPAAEAR
jgi:type 1 glutamine amidotransferase/nicotinamidase-related amidase